MKTLLIIDIQNDFLPGGALAVNRGDQIIPIVNELMDHFEYVVATQDYHPEDHGSFAANHHGREIYEVIDLNGLEQVLWPTHCVEGTLGAEFAPSLNVAKIDQIFRKGTDKEIDSYSGFFDNGHRKATGLADHLRERGVTEVYLVGLATDYCVKFTALDAVAEGFQTSLITDAVAGVDLQPGDCEKALQEMKEVGVQLFTSDELLGEHVELYRPVGPEELILLEELEFKAWPPRLPDQPIFYPVMNQAYAHEIAEKWNVRDSGSGYVTKFKVKRAFLKSYERKIVGGKEHEELWIPAEDLALLNKNLVGEIEVIETLT